MGCFVAIRRCTSKLKQTCLIDIPLNLNLVLELKKTGKYLLHNGPQKLRNGFGGFVFKCYSENVKRY